MFEIIEDNKHIILLIIVAILLLSTIFAGKSKSNEDKLQVLNNSIKILQKAKKQVNNNQQQYIPSEDNYEKTDFKQYYSQPESNYYENDIELAEIREPEMYEEIPEPEIYKEIPEHKAPKTEISRASIEDLIKDIRPKKKQVQSELQQQNSNNRLESFQQQNQILESDRNFNRIMELVQFKMNPTTNMRPNLNDQINTIGTGCNKDIQFELEGFDNKILPQSL
jgi:hypothetical protein